MKVLNILKVVRSNQNTIRKNAIIINQLSEKLIKQYKIRMKEKDKIIANLKGTRDNSC